MKEQSSRVPAVADVTVSIVSHAHGSLLLELLADLNATESLRGSTVLVTLNVPSDHVDVSAYPNLRVVLLRNETSRGFARNHNAAFARCTTEWFAVLNPDLRLPRDPFPSMLALAQQDERIALVAPVVTDINGALEDSVRTNLSPLSLMRRKLRGRTPVSAMIPGEFYWFGGMFMLFRSAAFRDMKGFDERFFLYCEDYDICARLHLAGYGLRLDTGARVIHNARRMSHKSIRHLGWHVQSLFRVWLSRPFWQITFRSMDTATR